MIYKVKDINIENHTYYLFNDVINIKNFDPNDVKIDEKSHKNILIYYIGYVMIKAPKYVKINGVNLYTFLSKKWMDTLREITGNKYLTLVLTNESKEKIKKYEEMWSKIRE